MITIGIEPSKNLPGKYSAYVNFLYDPIIVNALRSLPFKHYDKECVRWEIPIDKIQTLKDKLPGYKIDVVGDIPETDSVELPEGFQFKTKPLSHQLEGVKYGLQHNTWFLGDEQGCVSGESLVKIKEQGKPATRNIKIRNLKIAFDNDNTIKIKSLVNGRFVYMPIKAVIDKGIQKTIEITLENTSIQCTPDHLIYTENGWVEADKIKVGDKVFTNGIEACPLCGTTENLITYKYSKFLGYCKPCMYKCRNGTKYNNLTKKVDAEGYIRLFGIDTRTMPNYEKMHGMGIYEHHQVWYENTGHIVDTTKEVVHHKNGIKTDNRFENLQLLSISEHDKLHSDTKTKHLYQFNTDLDYIERKGTKIYLVPKLQEVKSKSYSSEQQVWDIAIDDDTIHNFICNNIVVHNCGKTKQVIDIAVANKARLNYKHCLIVCGVNTLKWNWVSEIHKHSNEDAWILGQRTSKKGKVKIGSNNDKLQDLLHMKQYPEDLPYFIITNIESFRVDEIATQISDLCSMGIINMCAADEMHKMKNPTIKQTRGFFKCLPECRIGMSGTPLMNSPLDIYVILKWLGYEKHAFYSFKNHFCVFGGFGGHDVIGYRNLGELNAKLSSIMLRRLKADVLDLPDKLYIDELVDMSTKQSRLYDEIEAGIKNEFVLGTLDLSNPLSVLTRLRQCTGYTGIVSDCIFESSKLDRMEDIIEEAVSNNQKVIVFSNWTQMTDIVQERLQKYNPAVITGATTDNKRQMMANTFQTDDNCKVIIGTIGAMGTGLTLTAGSVVIFLDEPWNKALFDQAVDRAHRIGTQSTVTIYSLMCKGTIDERIHNIIYTKGIMSDAIVDGHIIGNKMQVFDYLIG